MTVAPQHAPDTGDVQSERPKLVFVYSGRQGRSRQVDGYVAQILQRRRNHDTFELVRIDVDDRPDVAERLHVTSVPTLLVIAGRRVQGRLTDPKGRAPIAELLSPWLK